MTVLPWRCDDKCCSKEWHVQWNDVNEAGDPIVSDFGDGDWEAVEADEDVPTLGDELRAWKKYWQWVAEHGDDPLHELAAGKTRRERQVWQIEFRDSGTSVVVTGVRRSGRGPWLSGRDESIPQELINYLLLDGTPGGTLAYSGESYLSTGERSGDPLGELLGLAAADSTGDVAVQSARRWWCKEDGRYRYREALLRIRLDCEVPFRGYARHVRKIARRELKGSKI